MAWSDFGVEFPYKQEDGRKHQHGCLQAPQKPLNQEASTFGICVYAKIDVQNSCARGAVKSGSQNHSVLGNVSKHAYGLSEARAITNKRDCPIRTRISGQARQKPTYLWMRYFTPWPLRNQHFLDAAAGFIMLPPWLRC